MNKLSVEKLVPVKYERGAFALIMREIEQIISDLAEGRLPYSAMAAAPTTGAWSKGTFVQNNNPSEAGSGGSKYIVTGWLCVTAGSPGTWKEARVLTGN